MCVEMSVGLYKFHRITVGGGFTLDAQLKHSLDPIMFPGHQTAIASSK
jgi:hypothetical protein